MNFVQKRVKSYFQPNLILQRLNSTDHVLINLETMSGVDITNIELEKEFDLEFKNDPI